MAHDVFISYSSKDKPSADATCAALESKGIRCWIAPRDILPGADWGSSIVRAIAGSRVMVLVFSSSANTSSQIRREVERAANREIPIIPVRIENVAPKDALEFFLSTPHWLDAFNPPFEKHLERLADVVPFFLGGRDAKPIHIEPKPPVLPSSSPQLMKTGLLTARDFKTVLGLSKTSTLTDAVELYGEYVDTSVHNDGSISYIWKGDLVNWLFFCPGKSVDVWCEFAPPLDPNSPIMRLHVTKEDKRSSLLSGFKDLGGNCWRSGNIYMSLSGGDIYVSWW